jgi:hypothetical protein
MSYRTGALPRQTLAEGKDETASSGVGWKGWGTSTGKIIKGE